MALPKLVQSNDSNFEKEILRQPTPAVVCFWANWSAPSKLLTPVVAEMAETYSDSYLVGMIDVDESPLMSATYGVFTLPTFLVIKEGQVVKRIDGAVSREKIERLFTES